MERVAARCGQKAESNLFYLSRYDTIITLLGRRIFRITCGCGSLFHQVDCGAYINPKNIDNSLSILKLACSGCDTVLYLEVATNSKRFRLKEMAQQIKLWWQDFKGKDEGD